jgi:5-methylcytosine-specific restriction endonuclease McrA
MANSRRRCRVCRNYFPVEVLYIQNLSAVCRTCAGEHAEREERELPPELSLREPERLKHRVGDPSPSRREEIYKRDGNVCRLCGKQGFGMGVHHIRYRSESGCTNDPWNLVLLCEEHHKLMHSSKDSWQPVLLAMMWLEYVEGQHLRVLEALRVVLRRGQLR